MPNNLGGIITEARKESNMSQEQLARLSGVSAPQIANMEQGKTKKPRRETIVALATTLGLDCQKVLKMVGYEDEELQEEGGYFAEKLKKVRSERGLNKRQCAKLIGISDMQLANIENGKIKKPQVATIKLLSNFLELDYITVLHELNCYEGTRKEEADSPSVILGKKIRETRILKGIGQIKLAMLIDVDVAEIYRIEKGIVQQPRISTLKGIEECLGIKLVG